MKSGVREQVFVPDYGDGILAAQPGLQPTVDIRRTYFPSLAYGAGKSLVELAA